MHIKAENGILGWVLENLSQWAFLEVGWLFNKTDALDFTSSDFCWNDGNFIKNR